MLVWVVAVPATAGAQQLPSDSAPLVFDGVTVVDVENGKLLPDQRVVIAGNHIQTAGSSSSVPVPKGAQVVPAKDKYLIPGLWDLHVHPRSHTETFYPLFLANGVTGIRDAGSPVSLDSLKRWRQEILAGTRLGPPRQILVGPSIDGSFSCSEDGFSGCDTAAARLTVDSLVAAGVDMLKFRTVRPPIYFAMAVEARRLRVRFGGHAEGRDMRGQTLDSDDPENLTTRLVPSPGVNALEASDSGALLVDHVLGNDRTVGERHCWGTTDTTSFAQCEAEAKRFLRNGTWLVQTELAYLSWLPKTAGPRAEALIHRLNVRARQFWADSLPAGNWLRDTVGFDPFRHPQSAEGRTDPLYVPRKLGLPVISASDVDDDMKGQVIGNLGGFSLHGALALAVAEGLTPLAALQSATLNPARALGLTDSLGTVAAGKLADLVLLDANPLEDITNTTAIRAVVANGRYFDRGALDQLLTEIRANAEREP